MLHSSQQDQRDYLPHDSSLEDADAWIVDRKSDISK